MTVVGEDCNYVMLHAIILIALGFVMWKYLPGMITKASPKTRQYIDLCLQIGGIILMIIGVIQLLESIVNLFA